MFDRILVAVDGSDRALAALEMAVGIQIKFESELLILCVYRHYSLLEASMSMVRPDKPEHLDDSMREYAGGIIEHAKKVSADLGAGESRGFVKSGPPARTIVKFAKDKNADLIVLGSRGLGDIESHLLGSVSHKVTSISKLPVLVV